MGGDQKGGASVALGVVWRWVGKYNWHVMEWRKNRKDELTALHYGVTVFQGNTYTGIIATKQLWIQLNVAGTAGCARATTSAHDS